MLVKLTPVVNVTNISGANLPISFDKKLETLAVNKRKAAKKHFYIINYFS